MDLSLVSKTVYLELIHASVKPVLLFTVDIVVLSANTHVLVPLPWEVYLCLTSSFQVCVLLSYSWASEVGYLVRFCDIYLL